MHPQFPDGTVRHPDHTLVKLMDRRLPREIGTYMYLRRVDGYESQPEAFD
jgi:hypothetical protein